MVCTIGAAKIAPLPITDLVPGFPPSTAHTSTGAATLASMMIKVASCKGKALLLALKPLRDKAAAVRWQSRVLQKVLGHGIRVGSGQ